jgi:hypothetical protein
LELLVGLSSYWQMIHILVLLYHEAS